MGMKIDIDDLRKVKGIGGKTLERIVAELSPKEPLKPSGQVYTPTIIGNNTLYRGDALDVMFEIPDGSVDLILTDPPYGTTACKWDSVIPFEPMWEHLNRVIKKNGAIVLFGSEPFSSALRMSNIKNYKYDWVWNKVRGSNFALANKQPIKTHENVMVFYNVLPSYHPQKTVGKPYDKTKYSGAHDTSSITGHKIVRIREKNNGERFPVSITTHSMNWRRQDQIHPTQKPVALMEYLIKTYANEGETVLDFTMGSGTTGVACINTNRKFIGIELDDKYFDVGVDRLLDEMESK